MPESAGEGHVFLVQSGLINNSEIPERQQNASWIVRGGTFAFVVSCKMAIDTANLGGKSITYTTNKIYSKPLKLTNPMSSTLNVAITQDGVAQDDAVWGMENIIKSVPTGLWASCKFLLPSGAVTMETDPLHRFPRYRSATCCIVVRLIHL